MGLPRHIAEPVRRALEEHDLGRAIERVVEVGGGCINHGARLDTDTGASVFLKWNDAAPAGMFEAEADGLGALAAAGALRVPRPVAWSSHPESEQHDPDDRSQPGRTSWLLMEHVAPGSGSVRCDTHLGEGLAALHASAVARTSHGAHHLEGDRGLDELDGSQGEVAFGWHRDNWIGSLPQANEWAEGWGNFWRDRRLGPQLERARRRGHLSDDALDRVLDLCVDALADVRTPALLHGDLWGGNWFADEAGAPVLIDPAVYLGHGEVDLAMSELFGGFDAGFYDAYRAARGISAAYSEYRRDLYQLYYLLVHVNLFGATYERGCLRAARSVVAALNS